MVEYKRRFEGDRWSIVYGDYSGVQAFAIRELNRIVQRHMPYVVECVPAAGLDMTRLEHALLIGTPADNPFIAELIEEGLVQEPEQAQGYTVTCMDSPWDPGRRVSAH